MQLKLLKNPNSYFWLAFTMTLGHVIFMKFIFQEEWGNSSAAIDFTRKMASIVPMIAAIEKIQGYRNYWGVFYSILWIISPLFLIFGYASACFSSGKSLDFIKTYSIWKYFFFLIFFLCIAAFAFYIPDAGTKFWFNELSSNLLMATFTCLEISGVIFLLGRSIGVIQVKLMEKYFNQRE